MLNSWLHLFTNSTTGYFVLELAKFYDNDFDELLGVSVEGFDVYVHENKNIANAECLLELTQMLVHKHNLFKPWSLQKGEITSIEFSEFEIPVHQKVGS